MLEYPIYKHLIQFSSLIDKNGNLISDPNNGVAQKLGATEESKAGENDNQKPAEEDE